jgi:hypothetical protein
MSVAQLLELAAAGALAPTDLVSMEGADVEITVERFVALARGESVPVGKGLGSPTQARVGELPSWLADVIQAEAKAPPKTPPVALDWLADVAQIESVRVVKPPVIPDWLGDVAQTERPVPAAAPSAKSPPTRRPAAPAIPLDWLDDIRQIEESLQPRSPLPPTTPPPVPAKHPTVVPAPATAVPTPLPAAQHTRGSPPTVRPVPPTQIAPARPTTVVSVPGSPPPTLPQPAARYAPPPQLAPVPTTTLTDFPPPSAEQMGYDPETGRVLDAAVHARWQKTEALRRQQELAQVTTLSVAETFLEAQRLLQEWVDADENKALVVGADLAAVVNAPALQLLLRRYDGYGPVMREKLLKRLTFLVENRKKFFQAFS